MFTLRFLPPSLFSSPVSLISRVYLQKYQITDARIPRRLVIRGLKILAIFFVLNALISLVIPEAGNSKIVPGKLFGQKVSSFDLRHGELYRRQISRVYYFSPDRLPAYFERRIVGRMQALQANFPRGIRFLSFEYFCPGSIWQTVRYPGTSYDWAGGGERRVYSRSKDKRRSGASPCAAFRISWLLADHNDVGHRFSVAGDRRVPHSHYDLLAGYDQR